MIRVYNTLTRKLEEFKPMQEGKVKMFVCGPTVYDYAHLGHAKTYVAFDTIVKYLRYKGFDVFYLQNITDIDDKIIQRANELGENPLEYADKYYKEYLKDMQSLNVDSVNEYAKTTDYVDEVIKQVQGLIEKGYAYESGGNVYYSISKFEEYGKLSHKTPDEAVAVSRIDEDPYKREPFDFVIWKKSKPGEPKWESPWGEGRPGWHIEDTAISISHFGPQYDLHGGGEDLIFPHHEAEIAIAEALTGKKPFVKYWLHAAFLKIEGSKMSKSLKNFMTIRQAVEKYGGEVIRFFFSQSPYYRPIDFSEENLEEARKELEKIHNMLDNLWFLLDKAGEEGEEVNVEEYKKEFEEAMDNNFNTAEATAVLFSLIKNVNRLITEKKKIKKKSIQEVLDFLKTTGRIFGLEFEKKEETIPGEVMKLVEEREKARKEKNWAKADELRDKIRQLGYRVDDTPEGPKVRKSTE